MIASWAARGQESQLGADFRHEKEDFAQSCSGSFFKAVAGCAQDLFTDHPLHIAVGSLAPGNGFAAGPAFVAHLTPNESWRLSWNADAVASSNESWRAGVYMKAIYTGSKPNFNKVVRTQDYPVINFYAQGISLNSIDYYGLGNFTQRGGQSLWGMTQTIVGASAVKPFGSALRLSVFGEVNGRFINLRGEQQNGTPSITQVYTPVSAPGLASQPAFAQFGEGVRIEPHLLANHLQLNYSVKLREFVAPGSNYSFNRFVGDFSHTFPIYGNLPFVRAKEFNGPDDCTSSPGGRCPPVSASRNRSGAFGFRVLLSESFVPSGDTVPFYFQPTLGGSDIDGEQLLPSYRDYRFRAPNLFLMRGSFEHSIWGPFAFTALVDEGRVGLTRGDLGFNHLKHSFAAGLTLQAGGLPAVSFLFAWGGNEGNHTIVYMDSSLLGGSARPPLY
jgi:hypothetical protein